MPEPQPVPHLPVFSLLTSSPQTGHGCCVHQRVYVLEAGGLLAYVCVEGVIVTAACLSRYQARQPVPYVCCCCVECCPFVWWLYVMSLWMEGSGGGVFLPGALPLGWQPARTGEAASSVCCEP